MTGRKQFWKSVARYYYFLFLHIFALAGIVFLGVYAAVNLKLTNTKGSLDEYSEAFNENATMFEETKIASPSGSLSKLDDNLSDINKQRTEEIKILCKLDLIEKLSKTNTKAILLAPKKMHPRMILAVESKLKDHENFLSQTEICINNFEKTGLNYENLLARASSEADKSLYEWANQKHWLDVRASIKKDEEKIKQAALAVGIDPRHIVSSLMVEQLRLFYSQRELYQKFFEPLKILANSYQISLGVMSIKEETAKTIERNLKDKNSIYYLGEEYEHLLDYKKNEGEGARFARLTSNDHRWNYLYGAIYLKQFLVGWDRQGYNIEDRPEILATLFNVGFPQSKPNGDPKVGGSTVTINDKKYTFGRLAYEFYYSGEMMEEFGY